MEERPEKAVVIGYDGSAQSEDAMALGRALCDVLGAEPMVTSCETAHSPARELGSVAAELDAACIVVGPSHRSAVGRIALGSVGNKLVQGAPCAVAVAPRGAADDPPALLRIGVAFDGSEESMAALRAGIDLAERGNARLAVTTVIDSSAHMGATPFGSMGSGERINAEREEKRQALDRAIAAVPPNLPVTKRLSSGGPGQRLVEASAEVDLMVMGSRGYGPLGRVLAGSVATYVMHHAHSAVLVVPRGATRRSAANGDRASAASSA